MKLWIARSKDVDLYVDIWAGNATGFPDVATGNIRLLLAEMHRFRHLIAEIPHYLYAEHAETFKHTICSRLVRLKLDWPISDFEGRNSNLYLPALFKTDRLPNLRSLVYEGGQFSWWDTSFPSTLTELAIRRPTTYPELLTPDAALDALQGLPLLERLSLRFVLPITTRTQRPLRIVELKHLQELELDTDYPDDCSQFLSCLSFPSQAFLRVECLIGTTGHTQQLVRTVLEKLPAEKTVFDSVAITSFANGSLGAQILFFSDDPSGSIVDTWYNHSYPSFQHPVNRPQVSFGLIIPTGFGPINPECDTVTLITDLLNQMRPRLSTVRNLRIDIALEQPPLNISHTRIHGIFGVFDNVKMLIVKGSSAFRHILPFALTLPPVEEEAEDFIMPSTQNFPRLTELSVENLYHIPAALGTPEFNVKTELFNLANVLDDRQGSSGLLKLTRFSLVDSPYDDPQDLTKRRDTIETVERFKDISERIFVDHKEWIFTQGEWFVDCDDVWYPSDDSWGWWGPGHH